MFYLEPKSCYLESKTYHVNLNTFNVFRTAIGWNHNNLTPPHPQDCKSSPMSPKMTRVPQTTFLGGEGLEQQQLLSAPSTIVVVRGPNNNSSRSGACSRRTRAHVTMRVYVRTSISVCAHKSIRACMHGCGLANVKCSIIGCVNAQLCMRACI